MQATLLNNGTHAVDELTLKARFNGSNLIAETRTGTLLPGEIAEYTFNAGFELSPDETVDYTCVEVEITGQSDDHPENNTLCDVLNETFAVSNPYPNPFTAEVSVDVILPFADIVSVKAYNDEGQLIANIFEGKADKGYTRFAWDASALPAGSYTIEVRFRDQRATRFALRN